MSRIRVLGRDPDRRFVELEVDGKKVRVEKFTEEDWNESYKRALPRLSRYFSRFAWKFKYPFQGILV